MRSQNFASSCSWITWNISSQGSGKKPQNNPSPSAPPLIQSNPDYGGPAIQMPQPFGSGIGFVNHTNAPYQQPVAYPQQPVAYPPQNVAVGFDNRNAYYPNFSQTSPHGHPQASQVPSNTNYYPNAYPQVSPSSQHSNIYPPINHFPSSQNTPPSVPYGQGLNYSQTPPNPYPSPSQSAPFSYTQPNPNMRRSTSGYMRKVNYWEIPEIDCAIIIDKNVYLAITVNVSLFSRARQPFYQQKVSILKLMHRTCAKLWKASVVMRKHWLMFCAEEIINSVR